jgi:O-antigen/teichoic acid export membrane protein
VLGLVFALLCGSLWNVGWSIYQGHRLKLHEIHETRWTWKKLARMAVPFALAGLCVKVYSYIDSLMLKQFFGDTAVGYYAAAYKVTYAFQFLPLAFVAALYPGMSAAYADKDKKALHSILYGSMRFMLIFAVLFTVGLSGLSEFIVHVLFGKNYAGSLSSMLILPWVLIPIFLDFPIGSLLNSTHRAMKKTQAMAITMVVNVIANFFLIPAYGPAGAAIAGVISFTVLLLSSVFFARADFLPQKMMWLSLFGRGVLVTGVSWLIVRWMTPNMHIVFASLFAGSVVFVGLLASQLLLISDIKHVLMFLRRRPGGGEGEVVG